MEYMNVGGISGALVNSKFHDLDSSSQVFALYLFTILHIYGLVQEVTS